MNRRGSGRAVGCLLVACLVLPAACNGSGAREPPASASAPSGSPTPGIEATPAAGYLVARFDVANPQGFAIGFGSVWVPGHRDGTISRIDPGTNQVVAVINGVGYQAQDVEVADGSVWVPASGASYIARINPDSDRVISRLHVGAVSDIAFGFGSLWAATKHMQLLRIDTGSGRVLAKLPVGPKRFNDCNNTPLVTTRWIWIGVCDTRVLIQVDPQTNRIVQKVDLGSELGIEGEMALMASGDAIWIVVDQPPLMARLDADTGKVIRRVTIEVDRVGGPLWVDSATVWLGGYGILTAFDASSLRVRSTFQVTDGGEVDPGVAFGSMWVESFDYSEVTRFDLPGFA